MDYNSKFVDLLTSQHRTVFGFAQDSVELSSSQAAKGQRKKKDVADGKKKDLADGKKLSEFEGMWSIKMEDLAMKEKLSKMKLLESLIAKPEPLADYEEALKKKLITDLLA
ncbi:hypothetical protein Bca101_085413 [Brassica carinata]